MLLVSLRVWLLNPVVERGKEEVLENLAQQALVLDQLLTSLP